MNAQECETPQGLQSILHGLSFYDIGSGRGKSSQCPRTLLDADVCEGGRNSVGSIFWEKIAI